MSKEPVCENNNIKISKIKFSVNRLCLEEQYNVYYQKYL